MFRMSLIKVLLKLLKKTFYLYSCVLKYRLAYVAYIHAYTYNTHVYAGSLHAQASVYFSLHERMIQPAYVYGIPAYANAGPRAHAGT